MRLIINCSNLIKGGGIQVALSLIHEFVKFDINEYYIFLSTTLSSQINQNEFPLNFHFYQIKKPPSSFISSFSTIRKLKKLEYEINPDCVFTVFGPSYWTPKARHLIGFARAHYIYPEYFKKVNYSLIKRFIVLVNKQIRIYIFKRNADFYYAETLDVSKRIAALFKVSDKKVFTIGNTYNNVFNKPEVINYNLLPSRLKNEFRLITISAYYSHKNLKIINRVIPYLKKSNIKFRFILTLPENIYNKEFGYNKDTVINIGPVPTKLCPYLYLYSDALFLPTLLECFSASYTEAMKMRKPILTSDLSFARETCGDAAEYFDPLNPEDISKKIIHLATNIDRQRELIRRGEEQLRHFETPESRAIKILELLKKIIS